MQGAHGQRHRERKGQCMQRPLHGHKHACSTNTSRHALSCWPRCRNLHRHKHACITRHKRARNRNPLRWRRPRLPLWPMSASLGGSLFCSWTCPEQGSHTAVLDGSSFKKRARWPHLCTRTAWSGNGMLPHSWVPTRPTRCLNRRRSRWPRRPQTSPRPGVRVPGSTHETFQHGKARVARTCRARRPPLLHVTPFRAMCQN